MYRLHVVVGRFGPSIIYTGDRSGRHAQLRSKGLLLETVVVHDLFDANMHEVTGIRCRGHNNMRLISASTSETSSAGGTKWGGVERHLEENEQRRICFLSGDKPKQGKTASTKGRNLGCREATAGASAPCMHSIGVVCKFERINCCESNVENRHLGHDTDNRSTKFNRWRSCARHLVHLAIHKDEVLLGFPLQK